MEKINIAKRYIKIGFAVIPLAENDKKPILDNWTNLPRPTNEEAEKWFAGKNNVGIRCGEISNLIVVDVDLKNLIKANKAKPWEEIKGLPDTYKVKTANGGWHYYYRYEAGYPSRKNANIVFSDTIRTASGERPEIDIQSDKTQIVAPPSIVKQDPRVGSDYVQYEWDKGISEIKEFPLELFLNPPPKKEIKIQSDRTRVENVKERISIKELAESLGIQLDKKGKTICLWHNENKGSLGFSDRIQGFHCFGCDKSGDIFTLYQHVKGVDFPVALKELEEIAGIYNHASSSTQATNKTPNSGEVTPMKMKAATRLSELLDEDLGETRWLAEPLIAENGITILSGAPGQYKTFIALHLALCFAKGDLKVFGNFQTNKESYPVMIVDEENNKRRLQTRLKLLGAEKELPIFLHIMENIKLTNGSAQELLKEIEEKGIKVAIFDSLVRFFNFDENSSKEINQAYSILKMFLEKGISLILTHHHRKQGPFKIKSSDIAAISEAIRGSTDILAMCDNHLAVLPVERNEIAIIQTKQRDAESITPFKLEILENEDGILTFGYGGEFNEEESKKEKAKEAILSIIDAKEKVTREELENDLLGVVSRGYLIAGIKDLVSQHKIEGKTKKELGIECEGHEKKKKVFFLANSS